MSESRHPTGLLLWSILLVTVLVALLLVATAKHLHRVDRLAGPQEVDWFVVCDVEGPEGWKASHEITAKWGGRDLKMPAVFYFGSFPAEYNAPTDPTIFDVRDLDGVRNNDVIIDGIPLEVTISPPVKLNKGSVYVNHLESSGNEHSAVIQVFLASHGAGIYTSKSMSDAELRRLLESVKIISVESDME